MSANKNKKFRSVFGISIAVIFVSILTINILNTNGDNRSSAYSKDKVMKVDSRVTRQSPRKNITPTPTTATPQITFYSKTSDNITAQPGIASSVVVGCDQGDIAISSGIESYSGPINKWRTIRSTPSTSTDMNGMLVTVLNDDSVAHDFTLTTRCIKI